MQYHGAVKILACLTWLIVCSAPVWGQANFFEGKTVTVLIGAKSGSLEIASQIVAHHLGKHIPGKADRNRSAYARRGTSARHQ